MDDELPPELRKAKLINIRIFGVRADKLIGRHVKVMTRGHVNYIIYGTVKDVSESGLVIDTDETTTVIPVSQIKIIEIGKEVKNE